MTESQRRAADGETPDGIKLSRKETMEIQQKGIKEFDPATGKRKSPTELKKELYAPDARINLKNADGTPKADSEISKEVSRKMKVLLLESRKSGQNVTDDPQYNALSDLKGAF